MMTMTIFQEKKNLLSRTIQTSNHVTHEEETGTSKLSHLFFSLRMPAKQQYIIKEKTKTKQNKTEKQLISEINT